MSLRPLLSFDRFCSFRVTCLLAFCSVACGWGSGCSAAPPCSPTKQVRDAVAVPEEVSPRVWKYLVLHHSATDSGSVETIDAVHRRRTDSQGRPWRGIGYHFVIGNGRGMPDGEIASTFRWREQLEGAHAGVPEFNQLGIGICLIGNFEESFPTPAQIRAASQLIACLQNEYGMSDEQILRHGDLKATACPGKLFSMDRVARDAPHSDRANVGKAEIAESQP